MSVGARVGSGVQVGGSSDITVTFGSTAVADSCGGGGSGKGIMLQAAERRIKIDSIMKKNDRIIGFLYGTIKQKSIATESLYWSSSAGQFWVHHFHQWYPYSVGDEISFWLNFNQTTFFHFFLVICHVAEYGMK